MCLHVDMSVGALGWSVGFPEAGVTDGCELPDVDAGS